MNIARTLPHPPGPSLRCLSTRPYRQHHHHLHLLHQPPKVLFIRTFFCIMRDETLTNLRLLSHVACALLIGALYWDIGNQQNNQNEAVIKVKIMMIVVVSNSVPMILYWHCRDNTFILPHNDNGHQIAPDQETRRRRCTTMRRCSSSACSSSCLPP